MQLFSSFLDKDGVRSLKFYYQESVMPSIDGKLSLYLILSYSNNSDLMMLNLIDDEKMSNAWWRNNQVPGSLIFLGDIY